MLELNILQKITIAIIPILLAITLHEAAHGYAALWCGDRTAKFAGRLSLNPINHLDILGSVILPIITLAIGGILFGWAKPVPVDERNFKNPKRDMVLVALAGPVANLIMAFLWAAITRLSIGLDNTQNGFFLGLTLMGQFGISINLFILLFNLLPIPPLDGSRVISAFLKGRWAYEYYRIAPYGFWILLALIFVGALNLIIGIPYTILMSLIQSIFGI